ncbi:MAG TPA: family 16 glycoside hydrolase [Polyangiaceae bacterium]
MTPLRHTEGLTYSAIVAMAVAASCAKAESSPLAERGDDDQGGNGGAGGSSTAGGTGGSATGGSATGGSATGGSATGGSASGGSSTGGKAGSTSTGGSSNGGSAGSTPTTYGCKSDGEGGAGGEGGANGGAPSDAGGGGAGPVTLFLDDFEDGDADGWTPTSGSFGIATDGSVVYEQTDAASTSQYVSAVTGTCWTDQIVEARVKVVDFNGNSTSNAAVVFARYVSAQTHYMVGMNSGNNGELFIGRRLESTSNAPERIDTKTNMSWETNTWYTLRLEVTDSTLKAYLDGVLELEATDSRITSGGVAVGARHVNVRFDDVKVTSP